MVNNGTLPSAGEPVTLQLPAGAVVDVASLPAGCTAGTGTGTGTVTCPLPALAPGANAAFPIVVTLPQPGTGTFQATIPPVAGETVTANNDSSLPVTVAGAPDLVSTITGPTSPTVDAVATYTLTVTNAGTAPSAGEPVTLQVPAGMVVNPATLPAGCTVAGSTVTCQLGALQPGASASFAIAATPTQAVSGSLVATIAPVAGEVITANNNSTLAVTAGRAAAAVPVPTLGTWALLLLSPLMLLAFARRRRA